MADVKQPVQYNYEYEYIDRSGNLKTRSVVVKNRFITTPQITADVITTIKNMNAQGVKKSKIAKQVGISAYKVGRILVA